MESPVAVYAQNSATDRLVRCGPRATNGGSAGRVRCGSVNGTVELSSRSELSRVVVRWAVDTEGVTLWLDVSAVAVPNETLPRSEITV
jgi:hypothetical protein